MSKPNKPMVIDGVLHPDQIKVGSVNWFKWLAEPTSTSFNYEDGAGKFNARKESRKTSQNEYWSAYKRLGGRLRKVYIGLNDQLTPDRLTRVCQDINQGEAEFWLNRHSYTTAHCVTKPLANSYATNHCVTEVNQGITWSELEAQKAEAEQLRTQLGVLSEENGKLQKQLKELQQQVTLLEEDNQQNSQQLPDLEAVRERILSSLKVGKQAPEYKRTKAAIDRFIALVRS